MLYEVITRKAIIEELELFKVYAGSKIDYEFVNPTDEKMSEDERNTLQKDLFNIGIVRVEDTQIKEGHVITSYSIHYTKLYDPEQQLRFKKQEL